MQTTKPLKNADLDRKEWCFKSIPKHEVNACYCYEYFRELAKRSHRNDAVGEFRKVLTSWLFCKPALLENCNPNISWQELHQKMRSALVNILTNIRSVGSLVMEPERELEITNLKRFRHHWGLCQDELDR